MHNEKMLYFNKHFISYLKTESSTQTEYETKLIRNKYKQWINFHHLRNEDQACSDISTYLSLVLSTLYIWSVDQNTQLPWLTNRSK